MQCARTLSISCVVAVMLFAPTSAEAQTIFSRDLTIGSRGEDVRLLQELLNRDLRTQLANTGFGSSGNETTYFGPLTHNAVVRFQNLYAAEILTPLGLSSGTGYFGPSTRAFLNQQETGPTSGFIQETNSDSTATPIPLSFFESFSGQQQSTQQSSNTSTSSSPLSEYENQEYSSWLSTIVGLAMQPFGGSIDSIEYNCLCALAVNITIENTTNRTQPDQYMFYYGAQLMELMAEFLGIEELDDVNEHVMDLGLPIPRLYEFYALYPGPQVLGNYIPGEFQCWAFVGPPDWCRVQGEAEAAIVMMGTSLY